ADHLALFLEALQAENSASLMFITSTASLMPAAFGTVVGAFGDCFLGCSFLNPVVICCLGVSASISVYASSHRFGACFIASAKCGLCFKKSSKFWVNLSCFSGLFFIH